MKSSIRNGRLDTLRGFAILLVIGVHFHFYPAGNGVVASIAAFWRQVGPVGVILFFVLSGFLIGSSITDRNAKVFLCQYPSIFDSTGASNYILFITYLLPTVS